MLKRTQSFKRLVSGLWYWPWVLVIGFQFSLKFLKYNDILIFFVASSRETLLHKVFTNFMVENIKSRRNSLFFKPVVFQWLYSRRTAVKIVSLTNQIDRLKEESFNLENGNLSIIFWFNYVAWENALFHVFA